jgi:hypothetical protein
MRMEFRFGKSGCRSEDGHEWGRGYRGLEREVGASEFGI